jgi:rod shape-determining protein MreC
VGRRRALRRRLVAVSLLLLSVALLTLYFREPSDGTVHRAQGRALRVVAPLQDGAARVIKPFRDGWNWVVDLFDAQSQNRALRTEVERLRQQAAREPALQRENDQLRAMMKLKEDPIFPSDVKFVNARVIARSPSAWYSTVTVNVGSDDGVALYDAVVNGQGLVGRVSALSPGAAQVTLLTDQDSYVDSTVLPDGAQGLVAGSVTGDLSLQYVDKSQRVERGQDVVTSGRTGSISIRGIPIGTVDKVAQQDVELYQSVSVVPYVDFHTLDLVMVVTR